MGKVKRLPRKGLTMTIPAELAEAVAALARQTGRSPSDVAAEILMEGTAGMLPRRRSPGEVIRFPGRRE